MRPSYNVYVTPRHVTGEQLRAAARAAGHERRSGDRRVGEDPDHAARRQGAASARCWWPRTSRARRWRRSRPARDLPGVKIVSVPRALVSVRDDGRARARLHERDLGRGAARQEGRGLSPRRSHRPQPASSASGRATCAATRRLHQDGRRSRAGMPKTDIREVVEGPSTQAAVPGQQRRADAGHRRPEGVPSARCAAVPAAGAVVIDVETGRILRHGVDAGLRPERDVRPPDAGGRAAAARTTATSRCTTRRWARPTSRARRSRRSPRSRRSRTGW